MSLRVDIAFMAAAVALVGGKGKLLLMTRKLPPSPYAAPAVMFRTLLPPSGDREFQPCLGGAAKDYIIETTGSGVALFDSDNDGRLDVYLVNDSRSIPCARDGPRRRPRCSATTATARSPTSPRPRPRERALGPGRLRGRHRQRRLRGRLRHELRQEPPVSQSRATFEDSPSARRRGRQLDDRLRVRRLRWRRPARSVRCRVCRPRPQSPAAAPSRRSGSRSARAAPRPTGENRGLGASYSAGAPFCTYRGQRVMCGPRGLRVRPITCSATMGRDVHRREQGRGRRRSERPLRLWRRLVRHGRRREAGPVRGQRFGAESRVPERRRRALRRRELSIGCGARRQGPRAGAHGRGDRRLRQRRPRRSPHHELRRRLQRALPQRRTARPSRT